MDSTRKLDPRQHVSALLSASLRAIVPGVQEICVEYAEEILDVLNPVRSADRDVFQEPCR